MASKQCESLACRLREVLSNDAGKLSDFQLTLMEREIDEGWRVFYAKEIFFKAVLPAPLINEVGKLYAVEQLRCEIWRDLDQMAPPMAQGASRDRRVHTRDPGHGSDRQQCR